MHGGSADSPSTNISISMTDNSTGSKIISITDIIEQKVRKEKQLEEYETQLSDLHKKKLSLKKSLNWIEKEIQMVTFIIAVVRKEMTTDELVKEITKDQSLIQVKLDDKI